MFSKFLVDTSSWLDIEGQFIIEQFVKDSKARMYELNPGKFSGEKYCFLVFFKNHN